MWTLQFHLRSNIAHLSDSPLREQRRKAHPSGGKLQSICRPTMEELFSELGLVTVPSRYSNVARQEFIHVTVERQPSTSEGSEGEILVIVNTCALPCFTYRLTMSRAAFQSLKYKPDVDFESFPEELVKLLHSCLKEEECRKPRFLLVLQQHRRGSAFLRVVELKHFQEEIVLSLLLMPTPGQDSPEGSVGALESPREAGLHQDEAGPCQDLERGDLTSKRVRAVEECHDAKQQLASLQRLKDSLGAALKASARTAELLQARVDEMELKTNRAEELQAASREEESVDDKEAWMCALEDLKENIRACGERLCDVRKRQRDNSAEHAATMNKKMMRDKKLADVERLQETSVKERQELRLKEEELALTKERLKINRQKQAEHEKLLEQNDCRISQLTTQLEKRTRQSPGPPERSVGRGRGGAPRAGSLEGRQPKGTPPMCSKPALPPIRSKAGEKEKKKRRP